ncbi:MAG: terminase family protein [Bryobacterales bacterium]|nr:terminase family protein [Bryobacterales bacterium]
MLLQPETQATDCYTGWLGSLDAAWFATHRLGFTPDPQQAHLLQNRWRRCLLNCFRQWGKSTVTAAKAVHHAWHNPGSLTLIVSPSARQSAEFLEKAERFVSRLGVYPRSDGHNQISLALPNGSRIVGLPGKKETIRGFSAPSLIIIEEAGWVDDSIYHTVRPMLAPGTGELWVISTPNGQQGFFWEAWEHGDNWERVQAKASENTRICRTELAQSRRDLGERMYLQEYECEFTAQGQAMISRHAVQKMLHKDVHALIGDPWGPLCSFVPGPRFNIAGKPEVFLGVDLGQKCDFTAIAVLERYREAGTVRDSVTSGFPTTRRFDVRHLERIPLGTEWASIVRRISELSRAAARIGATTLAVDATGVGAPVVESLRREPLGARLAPVIITGGDKTTYDNGTYRVPRLDLLDGLTLQVENGDLRVGANVTDAHLLGRELLNLKRNHRATGSTITAADSAEHDDLVFATALAAWAARK